MKTEPGDLAACVSANQPRRRARMKITRGVVAGLQSRKPRRSPAPQQLHLISPSSSPSFTTSSPGCATFIGRPNRSMNPRAAVTS